MPPKSEAQRRAMYAAKAGKSTLGIPKKIGAEFIKALSMIGLPIYRAGELTGYSIRQSQRMADGSYPIPLSVTRLLLLMIADKHKAKNVDKFIRSVIELEQPEEPKRPRYSRNEYIAPS